MHPFIEKAIFKFTKCDSGKTLNPFMHVFLYMTMVWGIAMTFFAGTDTVSTTILYQETQDVGSGFVNTWGLIAMATMVTHTIAFWIRGKWGVRMMGWCVFAGFYLWLWAGIIYLESGFLFQFLIACVPNMAFWVWYAWQRVKRKRGDEVAFV